jgi:hypothetical protein
MTDKVETGVPDPLPEGLDGHNDAGDEIFAR